MSEISSPVVGLPKEKVSPSALGRSKKFRQLKPSQQVVLSAFLDPSSPGFLNQTQAYKQAHPRVLETTAATEGYSTLRNPKVQAALGSELERRGWDKDRVLAGLSDNIAACWDSQKLGDHREGLVAVAKVAGFLIEKRQQLPPAYEGLSEDAIWEELGRRMHAKGKRSHNTDTVQSPKSPNPQSPQGLTPNT